MIIEKNRKGSKCYMCQKKINGKKRIIIGNKNYAHLNCYWNWVNKNLNEFKIKRKQLASHRNYMIVEKLQDE